MHHLLRDPNFENNRLELELHIHKGTDLEHHKTHKFIASIDFLSK